MPKLNFKILFIILIIFFRILLAVRSAAFGPDESLFALRAVQYTRCIDDPTKIVRNLKAEDNIKETLQDCHKLPLLGLTGHLGIAYAPFLNYWLIFNYWLFNFHLSIIFFVLSLIFLSSAFLLAISLNNSFWVLILSLTSPLLIYFSLTPLWDTPWLIFISSLILFLSQLKKPHLYTEFIISILLGISLTSHIQALPFVLGFLIWRLTQKQVKRLSLLTSLVGIVVSAGPYFLKLILDGSLFNLHLRISGQENVTPDILTTFLSIFRFYGIHTQEIINKTGPWFSLEKFFSYLTIGILSAMLILTIIYFYISFKKRNSLHPLAVLFLISSLIYIPISWLTNSASQPQYGMMIWWFAPIMFPLVIFGLFPKNLSKIFIILLVLFNIFSLFIQYKDRIGYGTGIGFPLGPSWWMQKNIDQKLCSLAANKYDSKNQKLTVKVQQELKDGEALPLTLSALIYMDFPDCATKILFVVPAKETDVSIGEDGTKTYLTIN